MARMRVQDWNRITANPGHSYQKPSSGTLIPERNSSTSMNLILKFNFSQHLCLYLNDNFPWMKDLKLSRRPTTDMTLRLSRIAQCEDMAP